MINVHASLLPKYRGAAPVHRAVINGEAETGVTIMQVVEALDAGDMLAKSVRAIGPDETSDAVEKALAEDGARLLLEVIDRMESGAVQAEPQDDVGVYIRAAADEGRRPDRLDAFRPSRFTTACAGCIPGRTPIRISTAARLIVLRTRVLDGGYGTTWERSWT